MCDFCFLLLPTFCFLPLSFIIFSLLFPSHSVGNYMLENENIGFNSSTLIHIQTHWRTYTHTQPHVNDFVVRRRRKKKTEFFISFFATKEGNCKIMKGQMRILFSHSFLQSMLVLYAMVCYNKLFKVFVMLEKTQIEEFLTIYDFFFSFFINWYDFIFFVNIFLNFQFRCYTGW